MDDIESGGEDDDKDPHMSDGDFDRTKSATALTAVVAQA